MRALFLRALAIARDACLIIGITIVLFLVIETVYVTQGTVRRMIRREPAADSAALDPHHPNARQAWWGELTASEPRARDSLRYDPFRGWWPRAWHSRYINVDEQGRRVTIQPPLSPPPHRRVVMFGGSTMWGFFVRDSFTIPSLVASSLREQGYRDVEVVNLAQSTFGLSQDGATLLRELRQGQIPAVAVFLDGNNEVAAPFQSGRVGTILNEALLARRFERRIDLRSDFLALLQHSQFVQRLVRVRGEPRPDSSRWRLCDDIARAYERQARSIDATAAAFRFDAMFFWQPLLATTGKPLTRWERKARGPGAWLGMLQRCTAAADSVLASSPDISFQPLHTLFDRDSGEVFVDDYGHLTERANAVLAREIARRVGERLGPPAESAEMSRRLREPQPAPTTVTP